MDANMDKMRRKFTAIALQIRKTPILDRKFTDIPCCVFFILLVISFFGMGIYVLVEYANIKNLNPTPAPYPYPYLPEASKPFPRPHQILRNQLYILKHWLVILVSVITSIAFSYLYILFILTFPKIMVYAMLILGILSHAIIIVLSFVAFKNNIIGGVFSFTFFCYLVMICMFRKKFQVGIVIIQIAARILIKNKFLLLIPLIKLLLCVALGLFYAYSFSAAFAVINYKSYTGQESGLEVAILTIFILFWFVFILVAYYAMTYIVAAVCGQWYYKQENLSKSQIIKRSYIWMFKSFGSLVFTACLLLFIKLVALILKTAESVWKAKVRPHHCIVRLLIVFLFFLFSCLFKHLQSFVKYLNHYCVIMMSITGQSYIQSAKCTVGLLHTQILMLAVVNFMSRMLLTWGSMVAIGVPIIIVYCALFGSTYQDQLYSVLGLIVTVNGMISTLIFSIVVQTVSSVFVFYSIDERLLEYGLITKSRFYEQAKITLPQILQESLITSSSNRSKSDKPIPLEMDESSLLPQKPNNRSTNLKKVNKNGGEIKQTHSNRALLIQQLKQQLISESNKNNTQQIYEQPEDIHVDDGESKEYDQNEPGIEYKNQQKRQIDIQLSEYTQHIENPAENKSEEHQEAQPNQAGAG